MTEIPRDRRMNHARKRFATNILIEANDYRIVEGFGSNPWIISKIDENNFMIPKEILKTPLYPKRNGYSQTENVSESGIIYQAPIEVEI